METDGRGCNGLRQIRLSDQRPGLGKGMPLTEAQAKAATLTAEIRALVVPSPEPRSSGKDSIATTSTATTDQHHTRFLVAATLQPRHPAASRRALRRPAARLAPGVADLDSSSGSKKT